MEDRQVSSKQVIDAIYETFSYAYCDNCEKEMNEDLCGDCHRKYQNWSASKKTIEKAINNLPSAQPERTECIPDTKAVRSKRDCVDLAERVTATFYDQEHEEWTQQTVTIADVLDSVCDEYTILPSAQPDGIPLEWIDKHLEWLDNCDNDFAQLAKVGIRAMVEIWKKDKT